MSNIIEVARHEFLSIVRKRSFLFTMIGVPLFSIAMMILVIFIQINVAESGTAQVNSLGYVDLAGVLDAQIDKPEQFTAYDSEDAVVAAMDNDEIDAYFIVPQLYMRTGQVSLYARGSVAEEVQSEIEAYISTNLMANVEGESGLSPELLRDPVDMSIYLESSGREITQSGFAGLFVMPMVYSFVFMFALQFSGTFLMSNVVEEKANRIMEILITSITPTELLAGKLLGLGLIGLLQIVVWVIVGIIVVVIGQSQNLEALSAITFPLDILAVGILFFLLTYFLYASILAGVGVIAGTEQDSRQIAGIFILPIILPFFFIANFITDANGTIPTLLTLVPFTSGSSILIRMVFTAVPMWQILLSIALLFVSTAFVVWASAKVFRWGMLLYGKRPGILSIMRAIFSRVETGSLARSSKGAQS
ncbi:MAG: ABC transporter permease [Anaerolineaceae bacterium]|nr:ABC transporter permease [Anaerolineaceae bacterium]